MFAKMKTSTKVVSGFGVLLTILAALGIVSYAMFSRVAANVNELTSHSLAAGKDSTAAERKAFESIVAEKNYIIYKKDENNEEVKQNLAELGGTLDAVDKIAEGTHDTDLAKKSKEVRAVAGQFTKFYEEAVAAIKANDVASRVMGEKGVAVQDEAKGYMTAKKAEYLEAKESLAIVNEINALSWETRYDHRAMEAEHDRKHLDSIVKNCQTLTGCYDQLEKMRPDAEERQLIAIARRATQEYVDSATQEFEEQLRDVKSGKVAELHKRNHDAGVAITKAATEYLAAKENKVKKNSEAVFIVADLAETALACRVEARIYMQSKTPADWNKLTEGLSRLSKLFDDLRKVSVTVDDQQRIERADKATKEYTANITLWADNDKKLTDVILPEVRKAGATVLATAQSAENDAWTASDVATAAMLGIVGTSKSTIVVALIVGVTVVIVLGFFISKSISKVLITMISETTRLSQAAVEGKLDMRGNAELVSWEFRPILDGLNDAMGAFAAPVKDIGQGLQRMAAKDFSKSVEKEYPGAYGELRNNVNLVVANMRAAIEQITESAGQFAEGSRTIAESAQTLAQGAQTQSASVEEMTASTEELARSVNAVKDSANESTRVAAKASELAEQGGNAVQKSIESMEQIRTSSQKISEIIQVISEIASQTNLLALNAAIEAARAGEHGMGFAVVADEVRKLAERSNQAAREISSLIKESTQRVEEGAQLSSQTGEALSQIIKASEETAARISEIATATVQQAANTEEAAKAIQGVSQVTEQTAAGSEEMAASSEELGAQASALRELVGQFHMGSEGASHHSLVGAGK
jgi:methyl-accepting chemotaxis protein/CHASE3 domain sensor protein